MSMLVVEVQVGRISNTQYLRDTHDLSANAAHTNIALWLLFSTLNSQLAPSAFKSASPAQAIPNTGDGFYSII